MPEQDQHKRPTYRACERQHFPEAHRARLTDTERTSQHGKRLYTILKLRGTDGRSSICGSDFFCRMPMKPISIAYASRFGSTAKLAEQLAVGLEGGGAKP